ncbi:curli-like amyloid fiber formation chaperone CsgH (plasmid) [Limimaricola variabilis]|uniref:curli-like amyloid fiber formation chaperone CsgH n=1 Tax=Limimaricola variabilis TaxID=1492771 RepID=UPI002AC930BC|nr:curli-like amyloid fiber formation chaperone CsgH [Limimaricola variabilis]WPY96260.1 curli-like amyloid fiber formation chaperone CsgH [Limimaricola variabilis]
MRMLLLAAFVALPAHAHAEQCWIEVARQDALVLVEAFVDPDAWSRGQYSLRVDLTANGNRSTSLQSGDFTVRGMAVSPLSRMQLYSGNAAELNVRLTVSDATGRSCEDEIVQPVSK